MTLDPTPGEDEAAVADKNLVGWFEDSLTKWSNWFRQFILGYNENLRGQTIEAILHRLSQGWTDFLEGQIIWPWYVLAAGTGLLVLRHFRRFRNPLVVKPSLGVPFQARLLAMLGWNGFSASTGQTPKEFAAQVGNRLAQRSETRGVATIPQSVTELYYRVCYGAKPLNTAEQMKMDEQLDRLQSALLAMVRRRA